MNWKDFLKPDNKKVLLSIIIFILAPGPVYQIPFIMCIICFPSHPGTDISVAPAGLLYELFLLKTNPMATNHFYEYPEIYNMILFIYISIIIISYLISCLVLYKRLSKFEIFLSILGLFMVLLLFGILYPLLLTAVSPHLTPSSPLYDSISCSIKCDTLHARYNTIESAIDGIKSSDYCTSDVGCEDLLGECNLTLINGTQITVGCD